MKKQQKQNHPQEEEKNINEDNNNKKENNNSDDNKREKQINNNIMGAAAAAGKKRKRKEVFPYGNYRNYYGYRIGQDMEEDPRLKVLKREWFEGKNCLDIGCNNGIITIHIEKKFQCHSILGIDIDSDRIKDAYWHLRKIVREENSKKTSTKAPKLEGTKKVNGSEQSANAFLAEKKKEEVEGTSSKERDLLKIVSFERENFVHSHCPQDKHYDTILCLSVTKWIHLNWGDDGLITLFSKIWRLLRPGGTLVLEPQPWKSYESNRLVSEAATKNYRTIMFRPESFREILLDKIGFRHVEDITFGLSDSKTGFKRPIFAFYK